MRLEGYLFTDIQYVQSIFIDFVNGTGDVHEDAKAQSIHVFAGLRSACCGASYAEEHPR